MVNNPTKQRYLIVLHLTFTTKHAIVSGRTDGSSIDKFRATVPFDNLGDEEMKKSITSRVEKYFDSWLARERLAHEFNLWDVLRIAILVILVYLYYSSGAAIQNAFIVTITLALLILVGVPLFPGAARLLANKPNKFRPTSETNSDMGTIERARKTAKVAAYKVSTLAFFTFIEPGHIKAIIRGEQGRFIRFILCYDDLKFKGHSAKHKVGNTEEYWDVIKTPEGESDSHPIPLDSRLGCLDVTWWWSKLIYQVTGAVFTGFAPYQNVKTYQLESFIKVISDTKGSEGDFVLIRWNDFSDHVRAAEFQFFVEITSADTNDQVKVKIQLAVTAVVINPFKAYYVSGSWASRLYTAITQEVSTKVRGLGYKQVIGEGDKTKTEGKKSNAISSAVMALNYSDEEIEERRREGKPNERDAKYSISGIGIRIKETELITVDIVSDKLATALADVAVAAADSAAKATRSEGDARAIRNIAAAAADYGINGARALQYEAQIKTAAATKEGGGNVILTIGPGESAVDPKTMILKNSIKDSNRHKPVSKDITPDKKGGSN